MLRDGHTEQTEGSDTAMNVVHGSQKIRYGYDPGKHPGRCSVRTSAERNIKYLFTAAFLYVPFFQVSKLFMPLFLFLYRFVVLKFKFLCVYFCTLRVRFSLFRHEYRCLVYIGSVLSWTSDIQAICGVGGAYRAFPRGSLGFR